MSKEIGTAYTPQGMTQAVPEKPKTWIRKADGIYLHRPSGFLYWRPGGRKNRTWENLLTTSLAIAKERYAKLKYPSERPVEAPKPDITMGEVIRHYAESGYPDKHKGMRTGQMLDDETKHSDTLLKFWDHIPVTAAGPVSCDRYHTWRGEKGFQHGEGNRQVDRELNTLNNACRWAVRSELIKFNPNIRVAEVSGSRVSPPLPGVHAGSRPTNCTRWPANYSSIPIRLFSVSSSSRHTPASARRRSLYGGRMGSARQCKAVLPCAFGGARASTQ